MYLSYRRGCSGMDLQLPRPLLPLSTPTPPRQQRPTLNPYPPGLGAARAVGLVVLPLKETSVRACACITDLLRRSSYLLQLGYELISRLRYLSWLETCAHADDDRCVNPRIIFTAFHAPYPSKNAQIEYIYKNIIKEYIFQNFTRKYIFQKIKIFISKNLF